MSKKQTNQEQTHKISELITYYEVCNKAEGKSPRTTIWYSANLHQFRSYVVNRHHSENIDSIDVKLIREYILFLMTKHRFENHPYNLASDESLSSSTIHGHVRTLRAFSHWLLKEKVTDTNFTAGIKPPKIVKKVISTLSDEEITQILNTFNPTSHSEMRNKVMFMLLLDTGLRIGELISLKLDDIHIDEGLMKVMGKGKKERMVPIGNKAQKAIQSYLFRHRPKPAADYGE
jgi:integrase/recombinase XerD